MTIADIYIKVATLPVIAVGVGIGNEKGYDLKIAYYRTLNTTYLEIMVFYGRTSEIKRELK